MRKSILTLISLLCFATSFGQIVHYFDLPTKFEGRNVDTAYRGYNKGSFFKIQDTTYYINRYNFTSGPNCYIFKLSGNNLNPIDSFKTNYDNGLFPPLGHEPQVVVYKDTLFINTKTDLYKWEPGTHALIHDTSINSNGELFDVLALTNTGNPIVSFFEGKFGVYDQQGWTVTALKYGNGVYPEYRLYNILYLKDTMILLATDEVYLLHNGVKFDSISRKALINGSNWFFWHDAITVANGTIYGHLNSYLMYERHSQQNVYKGTYPDDVFMAFRDMTWYKGMLWATALKSKWDSKSTLYYFSQNKWHSADDEQIQWFYPIGDKMYVDGKRPGIIADFAIVNGNVRFDDGNCIKDASDADIFSKIEVDGKKSVYFSNDGYFSFLGEKGASYTVKAQKHYMSKGFTCGVDSINLTVSTADTTYTLEFAQILDSTLTDISIGLGVSAAVKGRDLVGGIRVKNEGNQRFDSVRLKMKFDNRLTNFASTTAHQLMSDSVIFLLDSLPGFEEKTIGFTFFVDTTNLDTGGILKFTAELLWKDSFMANNVDTTIKVVVRPYDPNMKESYPSGALTKKVEKVDYTIHFQNVGTSAALNVTVVDTLQTSLPVEYIRVKSTSHPKTYHLTVKDNVLIWHFKGINLPDSSTDEPGSKGFISYEAKVSNGLFKPGDRIDNRAFIYFDYEKPVITNTAAVYLVDTLSSVEEVVGKKFDDYLMAYPNPFNDVIQVKNTSTIIRMITVYDVQGKVVQQLEIQANTDIELNTKNLTSGIYYLHSDGSSAIKMIKY